MISLYNYINNKNVSKIDGHIHLFDHTGVLFDKIQLDGIDKFVGFMDVDFENLDKYDKDSVIGYYDNFIKKYYDNNITLLATGKDCDTMISLYKKYPTIIKGFGEIKCYSYYETSNGKISLPYGNLSWIKPLCEFNKNINLPIYIHWGLRDAGRKEELEKLLKEYSSTKFILCHCGMVEFADNIKRFDCVADLLLRYNNLYVDISYAATSFLLKHKEYFNPMIGRCFLGSDINMKSCVSGNYKKHISNFNKLYIDHYVPHINTIKKIFNI